MTAANSPALPDVDIVAATLPARGRRALLWGGAACFVLAAHFAVFLHWQRARVPAGVMRAPPAVMIDLAPLPAPPAPATPPVPAVPVPARPLAHPAPPPPPVLLPPQPAPVMPPLALPVAESTTSLPAPPPPPPRHKTTRPAAHRPPPAPPPAAVQRTATMAKTAPAPAPSATDARAPAPARPAASGGASPQNWQSRLVAHIAQYKNYPAIAQANDWTGTAVVRFTFRRDGTVISVDLIRGSGHAALDQAAISTLRRASPLPPPPAGVAGDPITLTLPLQFSLDQD